MVRAGSLNRIITIERFIENTPPNNDYGEPDSYWSQIAQTRASVKPIGGSEAFLVGLKNTVTHKIELRARQDFTLTPEDQIIFGTRIFDIQYVLNWNESNVNLTVLAVEKLFKD